MANQGPIAQEQMEELRSLNALKANGAISAEEYRRQKAAIMNRSLVIEATTRSVGGISESAVRTASSGGLPRIAKQAIALAVLLIGGYIGWAVYQSMSSGEGAEDSMASATDADQAAPPMDLATLTQDKPEPADAARPAPAGTQAAQTNASDLNEVNVAAAPAHNQFDMNVEPLDLQENGEPKPMSWLQAAPEPAQPQQPEPPVEAAASETTDTPQATAPQPPQPGAPRTLHPWDARYRMEMARQRREQFEAFQAAQKPKILWSVLLPEVERHDPHPFVKWCDTARKITDSRYQAVIGVTVGPEAKGFEDLAYIEFRDKWRQQFINEIDEAAPGQFTFSALPKPITLGESEGERFSAKGRATSNIGILFTTVQPDGKAYAYWFEGHQTLYRAFSDTVGKAKAIEEGAE